MIQPENRTKIVIIGGGFAGIETAHTLAKSGLALDITLVSKASCFQYYPSLYRLVVGATVNQVSIPLQKALPKQTTLIVDTYTGIDQNHKVITLESGKVLHYDYIVFALGSEPNYFGINGMEADSMSFLSIDKALALKKHFSAVMEKSKTLSGEAAKMQLHTIIVGAGPSGVEMAGALRPYLVKLARKHRIDPKLITVDLLDSSPRVLASIPEQASALVAKQLQKNGVTIYTNYGVNACDENCLKVTDKNGAAPTEKELHAATIIWTAGTKINATFATIPGVVMTDRKRVTVTDKLTLPTDDHIYIAGDGAGVLYSGLAQTAIDHGKYVGKTIAQRIKGLPTAAYEPKQGAFVIPVGKRWAIFNYQDHIGSGFLPYLLRIAVDAKYFFDITSFGYLLSMLRKSDK